MRQGANSAVRFSSYTTIKQLVLDYTESTSTNLPVLQTFFVGGCAGIITVCKIHIPTVLLLLIAGMY